ncbi:MAG: hypothetical protein ACR2GR_10425 [Rhodothermales bacterium]
MNILTSNKPRTLLATAFVAATMALTGCGTDSLTGPDFGGTEWSTDRADSRHGNNGGGSIHKPAEYNDDCEVDRDSCMD